MSPALPTAAVEERLQRWPVARLATLRGDGSPHLVPVVFAYSDGALWIPDDGKAKRPVELERIRNLREDPRVSLILDEYRDDWTALWWIRIDGSAQLCAVVDDAADPSARARDALLAKYPQYRELPLFRGDPQLIRIDPERRNSWCFDASAHR